MAFADNYSTQKRKATLVIVYRNGNATGNLGDISVTTNTDTTGIQGNIFVVF